MLTPYLWGAQVDLSFFSLVEFSEPLRGVEDLLMKLLGPLDAKRLTLAASGAHPVSAWGARAAKAFQMSLSMQGLGRSFFASRLLKKRRARYHAVLTAQRYLRAFLARRRFAQLKARVALVAPTNAAFGVLAAETGLNALAGRTNAMVR